MGPVGQICTENTESVSVCLALWQVKGVKRKTAGQGTLTLDTEHTVYLTQNCDYFVEAMGSLNDFF